MRMVCSRDFKINRPCSFSYIFLVRDCMGNENAKNSLILNICDYPCSSTVNFVRKGGQLFTLLALSSSPNFALASLSLSPMWKSGGVLLPATKRRPTQLCFSDSEDMKLAVGFSDGVIGRYKLHDSSIRLDRLLNESTAASHQQAIWHMLPIRDSGFFCSSNDGNCRIVWNPEEKRNEYETSFLISEGQFPTICSCHDGVFAASSNNDRICLYDSNADSWESNAVPIKFGQRRSRISSMCCNPSDHKLLALGTNDLSIYLYDKRQQQQGFVMRQKNFNGHAASVRSLLFLDDGVTLISTSSDGSVLLWGTSIYLSNNTRLPIVPSLLFQIFARMRRSQ